VLEDSTMTNDRDPLVSLVVATSGRRPDELRRLLESVRSQRRSSCEVLVIDQSTGLLDDTLGEYPEVVHVRSDVQGLSRNRNIGIARASGSIIAFPDDDCVLPPDYIENVIALASRFTDDTLFGYGNVLTLEDRQPFHELYRVGSMQRLTVFNCYKIPSVGLVFDRRAFARAGVFDERFGVGATYGAAEESDIMLRMLAARMQGVYADGLEILHPARPKAMVSKERHRSYSTAIGALARKHWQTTRNWRFLIVFAYSVARSLGGILLSPVLRDGLLPVYITNFTAKCRGYWAYGATARASRSSSMQQGDHA
jgi:glycosyltransferase involved in cell wall biosynthesis